MCAFKLLVHRPSIVFLQRTATTLLAVSALGASIVQQHMLNFLLN